MFKLAYNLNKSHLDVLVPNTWLNVSPFRSDGSIGPSACNNHSYDRLHKMKLLAYITCLAVVYWKLENVYCYYTFLWRVHNNTLHSLLVKRHKIIRIIFFSNDQIIFYSCNSYVDHLIDMLILWMRTSDLTRKMYMLYFLIIFIVSCIGSKEHKGFEKWKS